jgi:hypothetical protein
MDNNIDIELVISSATVQLNQLDHFSAGLKIKNNSSYKLGFDISKTELWVNGKKSIAWDLAVQNGTLINLSIPATDSEIVKWQLGNALFPISGKYKLELRWENTSQAREVTVFD